MESVQGVNATVADATQAHGHRRNELQVRSVAEHVVNVPLTHGRWQTGRKRLVCAMCFRSVDIWGPTWAP
jgi:hypothetical protein